MQNTMKSVVAILLLLLLTACSVSEQRKQTLARGALSIVIETLFRLSAPASNDDETTIAPVIRRVAANEGSAEVQAAGPTSRGDDRSIAARAEPESVGRADLIAVTANATLPDHLLHRLALSTSPEAGCGNQETLVADLPLGANITSIVRDQCIELRKTPRKRASAPRLTVRMKTIPEAFSRIVTVEILEAPQPPLRMPNEMGQPVPVARPTESLIGL
ncbi:MAG TPA: hypothetical protein VMT00_16465 [Thermoanaerobaculia bacterium]|nr:hypothetical protein [Thermoanaerobaculia bacterium]